MIKTEQLAFKYKQADQALRFPDIYLKAPEDHLLILGKSGRGKTTFLHLLAGLLAPSEGMIAIDDAQISGLGNRALDAYRGKNIGLVFQRNYTVQSLSVKENLEARLFFAKKPMDRKAIHAFLNDLGLAELKDRKINQLSQGQLQRLGIALSVVHRPKLILADEPSSSLDDDNCKAVIELLKNQALQTGAHLIVVTHDQRIKPFFQNSLVL